MILLRLPFYILFVVFVWTCGVMFGSIVSEVSINLPNSEFIHTFVSMFKFFGAIMYGVFVFVVPFIICCWFEVEYRERIMIDIEYLFGKIKQFFKKG